MATVRSWLDQIGRPVTSGPTTVDEVAELTAAGLVVAVATTREPTSLRAVQAAVGSASVEGAAAAYVSTAGYDDDALAWADRAGVALLVVDGTVVPVNGAARTLAAAEPPGECSTATPGARATVRRSRLVARLRSRWTHPVVAVVAGAGFGKSTLLAQAVDDNRTDPAGIDVPIPCSVECSMATVLGNAIALGLGTGPVESADPEVIATRIGEALAERAPIPVCLVLDDAHLIGAASAGADVVTAIIEHLPTNGHVLLASRTAPPVPLAALSSRGRAVVLAESDLAFDDDELAAFADIRAVEPGRLAAAGRWPALVELSATADRPVVREYLWDEVLADLEPERRRRLAGLAAIGASDAPMLRAALGTTEDPADLVAGLPLATVDPDGSARLHALWQDALAGEVGDPELGAIRRRAARHALDTGDLLRAFRLFREARDADGAREVVRVACAPLFPAIPAEVADMWATALREDAEAHPEADLLEAISGRLREDDPEEVLARFTDAGKEFAALGLPDGELACIVGRFATGFLLRDPHVQVAAVFDGVALADGGHRPALPLAALGRAGIAVVGHDYEGALRELASVDDDLLDPGARGVHRWMQGEQLLSLGRPADAAERFADVDPGIDRSVLERLEDGLVQSAAMQGDPEGALARSTGTDRASAPQPHLALIARLEAWCGRSHPAEAALAAAEAHGAPTELVTVARLVVAAATVAVARGDEGAARAHLDAIAPADRHALRRSVALPYVLAPDQRPFWDAHRLDGTLAMARDVAGALVAWRDRCDPDAVRRLGPLSAPLLLGALPLPWAAELAVAAAAARRPEAERLATDLGPEARPWIERLGGTGGTTGDAARRLLAATPARPATTTEVRLLGPAELRIGGEVVEEGEWRRARVRELCAFLAVHRHATREQVADALWPDLPPEAAANNLRVNLTHLLRALEPERAPRSASYFLDQRGTVLALRGTDRLWVDLWQMDDDMAIARRADDRSAPSEARAAYLSAAARWRGPFLPDVASDWARAEADRRESAFVSAALRAGELCLAAGDDATAEHLARRVLAASPRSEPAYLVLVGAHLARGDAAAARSALDGCRRMLDDLGVPASRETVMVGRRLLRTA